MGGSYVTCAVVLVVVLVFSASSLAGDLWIQQAGKLVGIYVAAACLPRSHTVLDLLGPVYC